MRKWDFHYCLADRDCRMYGTPPRMYFHTPFGSLSVTVPPLYRDWDYEPTGEPGHFQATRKVWCWEWPSMMPPRVQRRPSGPASRSRRS